MKAFLYRTMCVALVAAGCYAAPPTIGTLSVKGVARVDEGQVRGNATLFEGSVVETSAPVQLRLSNGAILGMDGNARGRVFADRVELHRGVAALTGAGFPVSAHGMRLVPETGGKALFNVEQGTLEVAPLAGAVQVFDSTGALLARVNAGESLSFDSPDQGGGAQGPSSNSEEEKKKKKKGGAAAGTASKAGKLGGMSTGAKTALALTVIGGGVGLGVGVYEATKSN